MDGPAPSASETGGVVLASPATRRLPLAVRLGLWVVGFVLALLLATWYGQTSGVANDFTQNVWLPARLVLNGVDPYNPPPAQVDSALGQYAVQFDGFNGGDTYFAIYPMWVNLLFTPFAALPLETSMAIWRALMLVLVVWSIAHVLRVSNPTFRQAKPGAVAAIAVTVFLGIIFRESLVNIIVGQFAVIELALLAGVWGYLIASRDYAGRRLTVGDSLAGLALAVLAAKPQAVGLAVLLVLAWAVVRRRWTIPIATVVAAALLLLLPLAAYPDSLGNWLAVVAGGQAASQMHVSASVWGVSYQVLGGVLPWQPVALALTVAGLVLLAPYWWWDMTDRTSPVPLALPVTLCVNSVVSPYLLQYEHLVLLLPALVFLAAAGLPDERPETGAKRWRAAMYTWMGVLPFLIVALQVVEDKEYVTVIQSATMLAICLVAQLRWSSGVDQAPVSAPQPSQLRGV
ncbi:MAG TPA: glycosyltransferase 87 family protein [Chloroflexia bacterium]|nr:glycosyltransferase 87 family protein [Chloroflexia bacterium]